MIDGDIFDQVRLYLPKYLTPEQQRDLFSELRRRDDLTYYLPSDRFPDEMLQGDGWRGFLAINFHTREAKPVSGVVLSNSCDISLRNARDRPVNVLFSPLVRVSRLVDTLREAGKTEEQIASRVASIRAQQITSMVYFPEVPSEMAESVIVLDDVHAHPLSEFVRGEKARTFVLTQAAFYLFVIKVSIHLTRLQEGIARF